MTGTDNSRKDAMPDAEKGMSLRSFPRVVCVVAAVEIAANDTS
jgi:hypothetical protein